jgi:hypothetical protein
MVSYLFFSHFFENCGIEVGYSTLKIGFLTIFAGGPIVYGFQRVDGALLFVHLL